MLLSSAHTSCADYAERYRDLPYIGTLDPKVYEQF